MADKKLYGFYSAKAQERTGTICYSTPSGGEVWVTHVSEDPNAPGILWPDKVAMGEVAHYLRADAQWKQRCETDRHAFR